MPAEASPLCSIPFANANPACWAEGAIGSAIEGIAGGAVRELAQAVVGSVQELFGAILDFLATPSPPRPAGRVVRRQRRPHDRRVGDLRLAVLPLRGRRRPSSGRRCAELGRVVGFTVLAFAVSGVALTLAQGFIAVVDVATNQIAAGVPRDLAETFSGYAARSPRWRPARSARRSWRSCSASWPHSAALAVYLELLVRNVMIHVVVYFLPLMLIGTIWAPTRRWAQARHRVPRRAHPRASSSCTRSSRSAGPRSPRSTTSG